MTLPVVAIVGRPNVGKSTLFNRLIGFRKAVVHDRPGVTRDRLYEETEILERRVLLIDTGGLEPEPETDLLAAMRRQSLVAVEEAQVIVFVVDGRAGYTPADTEVAHLLRRSGKPVILAINKIDGERHEELIADFWEVGIEPMVTVSAAHGRGVYELCLAIEGHLPPPDPDEAPADGSSDRSRGEGGPEDGDDDELQDDDEPPPEVTPEPWEGPVRIAVVGRPNMGKSTLINRLLGEDRLVVHDSPGTTMDPVDSTIEVGGRSYVLIDTAGVRRKARIEDDLERWVSLRSIKAIERCHVTLLLIDAIEGPTDQDAKLASLILDRGRAVVLLVNKWDLTRDNDEVDSRALEHAFEHVLPHLSFAPHLFVSAKTGKGLHRVLPTVDQVFEQFNSHISTGRLNRFLEAAVNAHTVPQRHHHPVRLYYMHQVRVRPPTFSVFSNTPDGVGPSWRRYLERRLREEFGFQGSPVRVHYKLRRKPGEPAV